jgi:hypothetical protein
MQTSRAWLIVGVLFAATMTAERARAAPPAPVSEGFMVVPSIGINSYQGSSGQGTGPGLRLGLLAGSRMGEYWSLNVGAAYDRLNMDAPGISAFVVDFGLSPLAHVPREKFEIVAGPIVGSFLDRRNAGSGTLASNTWSYGWTLGANAGVLVAVGTKVRLGGLVNFMLRNPLKTCATFGGMNTCAEDGLPSEKVLALSVAAMF